MFKLFFAVILFSVSHTFAQWSALMPISPAGNGMGGISSSFISDDPFSTMSNPAQLGAMSLQNNGAFGYYIPEEKEYYQSATYSVGMNLQKYYPSLPPLSIGMEYARTYWDMSRFFDVYEKNSLMTVGIGFDLGIQGGIGWTYIEQKTRNYFTYSFEKKINFANNLGIVLEIPVSHFIANALNTDLSLNEHTEFFFNATTGFVHQTVSGINPTLYDLYDDKNTLGLGWEIGFQSAHWKIISFLLIREVDDFSGQGTYSRDYLDDIKIYNNLILGKQNEDNILRKGWQINLGEAFHIRGGSFVLWRNTISSLGVGVQLGGIVKYIEAAEPDIFTDSPSLNFLLHHIDIQYNYASFYKSEYEGETSYSGAPFRGISILLK